MTKKIHKSILGYLLKFQKCRISLINVFIILKTWNQRCSLSRLFQFRFKTTFTDTCSMVMDHVLKVFISARPWSYSPTPQRHAPLAAMHLTSPGTEAWSYLQFCLLWLARCPIPLMLLPLPGPPSTMHYLMDPYISSPFSFQSLCLQLLQPAALIDLSKVELWKQSQCWARSQLLSQSCYLPPTTSPLLTDSAAPIIFLKWH